ncbi:hypothetical protein MOSE0_G01024 [Monosporozyma servazzii]
MKDLTGRHLLEVFKDDSTLTENQHRETADIWELATKSYDTKSFKDKNINVESLFTKAKISQKHTIRSRNERFSQVLSQSLSQLSQVKPSRNGFSMADILSKGKRRYNQQSRLAKPPRPFNDPYINLTTPLVTQLKRSISNINHTVRVSKLKKQFDILFRINSIKKLSNNEFLVVPSIKNTKLKYVLHIEDYKPINDVMISYHDNSWKVAIYSKATIKLSKNVYWCLSWEFIK